MKQGITLTRTTPTVLRHLADARDAIRLYEELQHRPGNTDRQQKDAIAQVRRSLAGARRKHWVWIATREMRTVAVPIDQWEPLQGRLF